MAERKVTFLGCGLIGGSMALALRRRHPDWVIVCLDLAERLPAIVEAQVTDRVGTIEGGAAVHLPDSSLVILATPVDVTIELLGRIAPLLRPGTLVTDVCSTKRHVSEAARRVMPPGVHFVGGHPVAGSHQSGVEAAQPLLFRDRVYVLCPYQDTPGEVMISLLDMVDDLMAIPVTLESEEHDQVLAMISHVPQLLAVAVMHAASEHDVTHKLLELVAGPGFLGLTRIAASDFSLWKGTVDTNRDAIEQALHRFESSLALVRRGIEQGTLGELWAEVSRRRRTMNVDGYPRMRKPDLRILIDHHDEELLKQLSARLQNVRQIGRTKVAQQLGVRDADRERQLLQTRQQWARSLDIPSDLVRDLFEVILRHSRSIQESESSSSPDRSS